jgi:hypothetical protein
VDDAETHGRLLEPAWGLGSCDRCGATLMLGEPVTRLVVDGRELSVCGECAVEPVRSRRRLRVRPSEEIVPLDWSDRPAA